MNVSRKLVRVGGYGAMIVYKATLVQLGNELADAIVWLSRMPGHFRGRNAVTPGRWRSCGGKEGKPYLCTVFDEKNKIAEDNMWTVRQPTFRGDAVEEREVIVQKNGLIPSVQRWWEVTPGQCAHVQKYWLFGDGSPLFTQP